MTLCDLCDKTFCVDCLYQYATVKAAISQIVRDASMMKVLFAVRDIFVNYFVPIVRRRTISRA